MLKTKARSALASTLMALTLLTANYAKAQDSSAGIPYGYNPYHWPYGPVYAANELNRLGAASPHIHGLDYGYGLGYFIGYRPPSHRLWGHKQSGQR